MSEYSNRAGVAQDEIEPPYDDETKQPKTLTKSRHIDDVYYLAGRRIDPERSQFDLMFVCAAAEEEEVAQGKKNFLGFNLKEEAEYLKGSTGVIKTVAQRAFIDFDDCYFTAVCKWLLPRVKRGKPPTKAMKWGLPIIQDEIKRMKPKIIVCMGKPVFDLLSDVKVAFKDAHGGWFWSEEYEAFLYLMYSPMTLVGKPDFYETFRVDFEEIQRKLDRLKGVTVKDLPVNYTVIRDEQSLRDWVDKMHNLKEQALNPGKLHLPPALEAIGISVGNPRGVEKVQFSMGDTTIPNRNGNAYAPGVMEGLVGQTVTPELCHRLKDDLLASLPPIEYSEGVTVMNVDAVQKVTYVDDPFALGFDICNEPKKNQMTGVFLPDGFRQFEDPDTPTDGFFIVAADCEWHGRTFLDGQLRSIQFAWSETDAVVIEFRNENNEFTFQVDEVPEAGRFSVEVLYPNGDTETVTDPDEAQAIITAISEEPGVLDQIRFTNWDALDAARLKAFGPIEDDLPEAYERKQYAYIGSILGEFLDDPEVRYIGHHFSADSPWMAHWLGLCVIDRCILDTEFAQQTVDESSELSLERGIAMKYTTLGLYNLDLSMWKRENKAKWAEGYGYVPTEIITPYSIKDVLTPMRAYGPIRHQLKVQSLWVYYQTILNPFVTTVFHEFHMIGLPMDMQLLSEMRELYHFVRDTLDVKFKRRVHAEAQQTLMARLFELRPIRLTPEEPTDNQQP